ncbi:MAG: DUF2061 domain-containing protein [Rickettsiales bacterium]|nr:DUF2061 domain-containing protein [Rickettsiales bacterium]
MRLAMKTVSYGLVHVVVATVVAYSLTQDLAVSLGIGLIEPLVQTVVFAIHDYVWEGNQTSLQHDNMLEIGG